jgi:hypothetical protein
MLWWLYQRRSKEIMNEEQEKLFEEFLEKHANKRVIAANGAIYELIEEILKLNQESTNEHSI